MPTETKKARFNMMITATTLRRMERLCDRTGAKSLTEAIRRALSVYETVTDHTRAGGALILRDKDGGEKELVLMP